MGHAAPPPPAGSPAPRRSAHDARDACCPPPPFPPPPPPLPDDWKFFNKKVPKHLLQLHKDGYQLVIFRWAGGRMGWWVGGLLGGRVSGWAGVERRGGATTLAAPLARAPGQSPPAQAG